MIDTRITEWLNTNQYRAYPLVSLPKDKATADYLSALLSDFKAMLYDPAFTSVTLVGIDLSSISLSIAGGDTIQVPRPAVDTDSYVVEHVSGDGYAIWVTYGRQSRQCPALGAVSYELEPALVVYRGRHKVSSLAGLDDDHGLEPEDHVITRVLQGDIKLRGGYGIQIVPDGSVFAVNATPGQGEWYGYPCIDVYGPDADCVRKILQINGVQPDDYGRMDFVGGDGVRVEAQGSVLKVTSLIAPDRARCTTVGQ